MDSPLSLIPLINSFPPTPLLTFLDTFEPYMFLLFLIFDLLEGHINEIGKFFATAIEQHLFRSWCDKLCEVWHIISTFIEIMTK